MRIALVIAALLTCVDATHGALPITLERGARISAIAPAHSERAVTSRADLALPLAPAPRRIPVAETIAQQLPMLEAAPRLDGGPPPQCAARSRWRRLPRMTIESPADH